MFENKKIFILGMGRSGISVAKLLADKNEVVITDKKEDIEGAEILKKIGVEVIFTDDQESLVDSSFDVFVKNPGVKLDHPAVLKAEKLNIPVITELEVAYRYLPDVKIIGITGSNGKTTTTTLTYNFLKEASLPVHLAGNIGIPLCDRLKDIKDGDILVLEISSHQLVNLDKFKVDVAALTNLSEVHIDHFGTYENYKNVKLRIFNHQTSSDTAIINKGDDEVYKRTLNLGSRKLYFSSKDKADIYIDGNYIIYEGKKVLKLSDIKIKGVHNYENIMCASLIVRQFNVPFEIIKRVLSSFGGVAHRMEFVKNVHGREFYNDSKATNVVSTITALKSFNENVILILGGLDRGHSFDDLIPYLDRVKLIVCYGETKDRIVKFAHDNSVKVITTGDVRQSVHIAYDNSSEGDTILLSPACASWDQWDNFEMRGDAFKDEIENI